MQHSSNSSIDFHVYESSEPPCNNCESSTTSEASQIGSDIDSEIDAASRHTESLVLRSPRHFPPAPKSSAPQIPASGAENLRDGEGTRERRAMGESTPPHEGLVSVSALTASGLPLPLMHSSMEWVTPPSSSSRRKMMLFAGVQKSITPVRVKVQEESEVVEHSEIQARENEGRDTSDVPCIQLSSKGAVEKKKDEAQKLRKQLVSDDERLVKGGGCSNILHAFQRFFHLGKSKKKREKEAKKATAHISAVSEAKPEDQKEQKTSGVRGGPLVSSDTRMNVHETPLACVDSAQSRGAMGYDVAAKSESNVSRLSPPKTASGLTKTGGDTWAKDEVREETLKSGEENRRLVAEATRKGEGEEELGESNEELDDEEENDYYSDDYYEDDGVKETEEEKKEKTEREDRSALAYEDFEVSPTPLQKEKDIIEHETCRSDGIVASPSRERTQSSRSHARRDMRSSSGDSHLRFDTEEKESAIPNSEEMRLTQSQSHTPLRSTFRTAKGETGEVASGLKDYEERGVCEFAANKVDENAVPVPVVFSSPQSRESSAHRTRRSGRNREAPLAHSHCSTNHSSPFTARALWRVSPQTEWSGGLRSIGHSMSPPPRAIISTGDKMKSAALRKGGKKFYRQQKSPQIYSQQQQQQQQRQSSRHCNSKKQNTTTSLQRREVGGYHGSSSQLQRGRETPKRKITSLAPKNAASNLAQKQNQSLKKELPKKVHSVQWRDTPSTAIDEADIKTFTTTEIGHCSGNSYAQLATKQREYSQNGGSTALQNMEKHFTKTTQSSKDSPVRIAGLQRVSHSRSLSDGLSWRDFKTQFYSHEGFALQEPTLEAHTCGDSNPQHRLPDTDEEKLALLIAHTRASCVACRSSKRELRLWDGIEHLLKGSRRVREEFYETPPSWWKSAAAIDAVAKEALTYSMKTPRGGEDISTAVEERNGVFGDSGAEEKQKIGLQPQDLYSNASAHVENNEHYKQSIHLKSKTTGKDKEGDGNARGQTYQERQMDNIPISSSEGSAAFPTRSSSSDAAVDEKHYTLESVADEGEAFEPERHVQEGKLYYYHDVDGGSRGELHLPETSQHHSEELRYLHGDTNVNTLTEDGLREEITDNPMVPSQKATTSSSYHFSTQHTSERGDSAGSLHNPQPIESGLDGMHATPPYRPPPHVESFSDESHADPYAGVRSAERRGESGSETGSYAFRISGETGRSGNDYLGRADPSWEEERQRMEHQLITLAAERSLLKEQLGIYTMFEEAKRKSKGGRGAHSK